MNKIYSIETQYALLRKFMDKNVTTLITELVEAHGKIRLYMVKRHQEAARVSILFKSFI
jgi:hypothetical protein